MHVAVRGRVFALASRIELPLSLPRSMPVLAPPRTSFAARPVGGNVLRGLPAPPRTASAAPAAANKIVRFLRTRGLPAPAASQLAPLAAGLAEMGRRPCREAGG